MPQCLHWTCLNHISNDCSRAARFQRRSVRRRRPEPCHQTRSTRVVRPPGAILCPQFGHMPLNSEIKTESKSCRRAKSSLGLKVSQTRAGQSDFGRNKRDDLMKGLGAYGEKNEANQWLAQLTGAAITKWSVLLLIQNHVLIRIEWSNRRRCYSQVMDGETDM